jgi:hypothetical protein
MIFLYSLYEEIGMNENVKVFLLENNTPIKYEIIRTLIILLTYFNKDNIFDEETDIYQDILGNDNLTNTEKNDTIELVLVEKSKMVLKSFLIVIESSKPGIYRDVMYTLYYYLSTDDETELEYLEDILESAEEENDILALLMVKIMDVDMNMYRNSIVSLDKDIFVNMHKILKDSIEESKIEISAKDKMREILSDFNLEVEDNLKDNNTMSTDSLHSIDYEKYVTSIFTVYKNLLKDLREMESDFNSLELEILSMSYIPAVELLVKEFNRQLKKGEYEKE